MPRRVASLVLTLAASLGLLLADAPFAAAEPPEPCGPHAPEDRVVQVFSRGDDRSALLCGSRYYGFRRIDWGAVSPAAVARTLASPVAPRYDERSDTWVYTGEVVVVISGGDGQVITARPVEG